MSTGSADSSSKFDASRAGEYAEQSRIALAGYDACHELSACVLSTTVGSGGAARVLVVGAGGTAGEIVTAARLEPRWSFVAVDPSAPMSELARASVAAHALGDRVEFVLGDVADVRADERFDAAIMIGVLHHLPTDADKERVLGEVARRLPAGAPFVVAGNYRAYESEPVLLATWKARWRMFGASDDEADAKIATILAGAQPPSSEEDVARLLASAGFAAPLRFFGSLFWGAWVTSRNSPRAGC